MTLNDIDFLSGTLLLINKPKGWTSFDVVNKVRGKLRYKLGVKKIKVGHSGTLDPMATGLLLICTGKWTKKLAEFQNLPKEYTGTMKLGGVTASYDAETDVEKIFPTEHITGDLIENARKSFLGEIEQIPPMYSAIKIKGQPLYKLARKGEKVEIKPRKVTIYNFELKNVDLPDIDFLVSCSKGTYIRSLAYDFGRALNSGAYLTSLTRTKIGDFRIEDAWDLDVLIDEIEEYYG